MKYEYNVVKIISKTLFQKYSIVVKIADDKFPQNVIIRIIFVRNVFRKYCFRLLSV